MSSELDKSEIDASDERELNFEDDPSLQDDPEFNQWMDREEAESRTEIDITKAPF